MAKQYVHYKDELVTINPALVPADSQGTVMDILGEIAGQVRSATGSTNWYDTPEDSIKGIIDRLGVRPVRAATTANHGLSGLTAVDGVSIVDGDLVLAKNQTTGSQNGIWVAHSGSWTRPTDLSASGDFKSGLLVSVAQGTANAHTVWVLSTYVNPIVPGTTSLTFDQVGGSGGSVDATTSAKGISKMSVAPVSATNPIAVGDNDPRLSVGAATTSAAGIVKVNTAPASAGDPIVVSENFPGLESYITGLTLTYVSGSAITLTTGAAYVPSLNRVLNVPSNIAKTGLTWSANTLYHAYLYSNSGTPDVEFLTTAPTVYKGNAQQKTSDNSRRYVGSVRSDGAGTPAVYRFGVDGDRYRYVPPTVITAAPWALLVGGTTTLKTNISTSGLVPVNTNMATLNIWGWTARDIRIYGPADAPVPTAIMFGSSIADIPLDSSLQFAYDHTSSSGADSYIYLLGYRIRR